MKGRVIVLSCVVLFSPYLFGREKTDVVVMNNGDRLTCEIDGLSAGVLSIKLAYVQGAIGVDWGTVARLESNQLFRVQTEGGTVYTGKLSTVPTTGDRPMSIQIATCAREHGDDFTVSAG
jgi:hypothetical protein